jgi:hypothetical protein
MIKSIVSLTAVLTALAFVARAGEDKPPVKPDKPAPVTVGDYRLSGPHTSGNLTIYLLHGKDKSDAKEFLTLEEAMAQKVVVVNETGSVNQLTIENLSTDKNVYIQSGEIVKGGRQDRTLQNDLILPPKSGKLPLASFCVEHGRWSGRGGESAAVFASSNDAVASKELKIASKVSGNQGEVWKEVAKTQDKLSSSVGQSVNAPVSGSSLQLSLENEKVKEKTEEYIKELSKVIEKEPDAVGYAFAINGKFNSADVYASAALFRKLWPKLLKASAVEAVAEIKKDQKFEAVKATDVQTAMLDAEKGKETEKAAAESTQLKMRESDKNLMFETRAKRAKDDTAAPAAPSEWTHRNYIQK